MKRSVAFLRYPVIASLFEQGDYVWKIKCFMQKLEIRTSADDFKKGQIVVFFLVWTYATLRMT